MFRLLGKKTLTNPSTVEVPNTAGTAMLPGTPKTTLTLESIILMYSVRFPTMLIFKVVPVFQRWLVTGM